MPIVALPYNLTNGTTADAAQVMADLNQLLAAVNAIDAANIVDGSLGLNELATAVKNNFLKLATPADRKEAFGLYGAVPGWGGTDAVGGSIPHGLGVVPVHAQLTPTAGDSGAQDISAMVVSLDATNINYRLVSNAGPLSFPGVQIHWRAIA